MGIMDIYGGERFSRPAKFFFSKNQRSRVVGRHWTEPYIHTVYDRLYGDFPAKNTVYTPYIPTNVWLWPTLRMSLAERTQHSLYTVYTYKCMVMANPTT
jgi:hypothetical protein